MPWNASTRSKTITIGIDPDISKSGVAIKDISGKLELLKLPFFGLLDRLAALQSESAGKDVTLMVVIEAGWQNKKSNFHGNKFQKKNVGERIAKNVGENHQVGKKIAEMCEYLGITYKLVRPSHGKMSPEIFEMATGIKTRDQEKIDAAVLIL